MIAIKRLLLLILLTVAPAFGTVTQLTGTLTDSTGNPLSGTACLKLPVNAIDTSTNRALSPQQICFPLTNGVFPTFARVVPNDVIQPFNTYYQFKVTDRSGGLVFMANYVIPTGGGTFNIGTAVPTSVTTASISYPGPGLLNFPNTWTAANTFNAPVDMSGASAFRVPVGALLDPVAVGGVSFDSTAARLKYHNGGSVISVVGPATVDLFTNKSTSAGPLTGTVASGTATMTVALIGAGACGTTVTVAATNVLTTDSIEFAANAAVAANPGVLTVNRWPTANNVNFNYCNPTAAGVTPNATTLNWRVVR